MGKITGFLETPRRVAQEMPPHERIRNFQEFTLPMPREQLRKQAARCMDCGVPYCHTGCPVNNRIPDWNDLVWNDQWRDADAQLHATNNFPEITGRICPAPCEEACTLNFNDQPVAIKAVERAVADRAISEFRALTPQIPASRSNKRVAVIGSGPAGLACAQQLARAGHVVRVFEKNARPGGLLTYGIPDFKLEKRHIAARVQQMSQEGVEFICDSHVGVDVSPDELLKNHHAVVIAVGAENPRNLDASGRDLPNVHFAMDYLTQQNRRVALEPFNDPPILAKQRRVVVIGGGDTGSDCIGTAFRQGAQSVTQLEILPQPPENEDKFAVWPDWPVKMRTSSSQAEGAERAWSSATVSLQGAPKLGVQSLVGQKLDHKLQPVPNSEFSLPADLVLLAMGFLGPQQHGLLHDLKVQLTPHSAILADERSYQTSLPNVFACGDARRGQSLVVWAIHEGRSCARSVDVALNGESSLPD